MSQIPRKKRVSGKKIWLPLLNAIAASGVNQKAQSIPHSLSADTSTPRHLAGLCLLSMSLYFPSASSCTSLPYTKVKGAIRRSVQESGGCHLAEGRTPWCDLPTPSTIPDCLRPPLTALAWRFTSGCLHPPPRPRFTGTSSPKSQTLS